VRAGAERAVQTVRGMPPRPDPAPASLRLGDLGDDGEWIRLGARPAEEFVFGALGRFWSGRTEWVHVAAAQFAEFDSPGVGKIAANLSFRDYGATQTLVSYEARTVATDPASRAQFLRYWRVVDPFVGVVMRGTLRLVSDTLA
jgi:hypothetical protein